MLYNSSCLLVNVMCLIKNSIVRSSNRVRLTYENVLLVYFCASLWFGLVYLVWNVNSSQLGFLLVVQFSFNKAVTVDRKLLIDNNSVY